MPVGPAGHAGAVGIHRLVSAYTTKRGHTLAGGTADDIREMTVPVIALLWIVGSGVTVDAARRSQNRIDLLPRGQSIGNLTIARRGFPFTDLERAYCRKRNQHHEDAEH